MSRRLKVLLVFDVPYAPPNHLDPSEYMVGDEWRDERDVMRALRRLGHEVAAFGVFDDVQPLIDHIRQTKPDVVFNQCESFSGDRAQEANLPALLEMLGVPYTGARPEALSLCKDKGLTKKILTYHDVRVPEFHVSHRQRPIKRLPSACRFPAIIKPLGLDSSEGISQSSLVKTEEEGLARVRFIHDKLESDAIIEEYIDGRELYVGVFGNDRLTVLPPQELYFKQLPEGAPRVLTYKAKWDEKYREKYGIDSDPARPIAPKTLARINDTCKQVYRLFKITGYARVDLRLGGEEDVVFLEVNPNPSIKKRDDFAWAAKQAGIPYDELLGRILNLALAG